MSVQRTPRCPLSGTQDLDFDLETDLEDINITPGGARDDGGGDFASQEDQDQEHKQAPPASATATAPVASDWPRVDWDDPDDGGSVAESLGVPVASIGKPFRAWLDGLIRSGDLDLDTDFRAFLQASKDSAGKRNPVGYLQTILPGYVAQSRADTEKQAAADRAEREAKAQAAREEHERQELAVREEQERAGREAADRAEVERLIHEYMSLGTDWTEEELRHEVSWRTPARQLRFLQDAIRSYRE